MDRQNYQGKRWALLCGRYEGVEKFACNELYKLVQQYVPYVLTAYADGQPPTDIGAYHVILAGTRESNPHIARLEREGILRIHPKAQGYTIKVCPSVFNPDMQMIVLAGTDEYGLLYAVRDFEHEYCDPYLHHEFKMSGSCTPFLADMPEYESSQAPAIENRGLWTWGHVIYDYRRYLDHMSRWKMNLLTVWNDYAPLNARDIVGYAHERGIRVVWGYSWCWGEQVDPNDAGELDKWTRKVVDTYEEQYLAAGGDGIYFQIFTETGDSEIDGVSIAELAVKWVNHISGALLGRHPDLWIQFGMHASSVQKQFMQLERVDSRLSILWEDGGCFPYAYDPGYTVRFDEALEFTRHISQLRGEAEDFGVVIKGMTTLDWTIFEHQKGPFILGETKESFIEDRTREKMALWKYIQAYWVRNLECVLDTVRVIAREKPGPASVCALVEDGIWERYMWQPVALCAQALWNPFDLPSEIIRKVSLANDSFPA